MKSGGTPVARLRPAFVIALGLLVAGAGCERFQQQGPVPTYPDSKLEAMRAVTGATLPHDPHTTAAAAGAAPPAASARADLVPRGR